MNIRVTCLNTSEIKKAIKGMSRSKARGADGLSINLIKDAKDFLLEKIAILFTRCLQTCSVHSAWKNVIVILIHKKRHEKPKSYRPISLLSEVNKLFTQV